MNSSSDLSPSSPPLAFPHSLWYLNWTTTTSVIRSPPFNEREEPTVRIPQRVGSSERWGAVRDWFLSPSPPSGSPLPAPNWGNSASYWCCGIRTGARKRWARTNWTENLATEGQDWDKSHQFQGLLVLSLSLRPCNPWHSETHDIVKGFSLY